MTTSTLEVLQTGPLAIIEDLGRPGLAHLGVTRSGAADRRAHALANRLLGNPAGHAAVEVTFGGLSVRVRGTATVTVTGADAQPSIDGKPFGSNTIQLADNGQVISLGTPRTGVRSYLAVRGGFDVAGVLGSRSHDVLSAIGPPPLRRGDVLAVGAPLGGLPGPDVAPVAPIDGGVVHLVVVPGPRADWFADPDLLTRTGWTVTDDGDRVGIRLSGTPLRWCEPDRQLPSEGAVRGSIQVPPNGLPVILGPDHPVTGGYPVIGVVVDGDCDGLAQVRPGQPVRFRWSRPRTEHARSTPALTGPR